MQLKRRQWHPTPVLLPGKSHGQRSLVGCSPWGHEESATTEQLHFHFSLSCIGEGNGNPLHCSCLENPRDRRAWWAAVYGVAQSRTRLKRLSSSNMQLRGSGLNMASQAWSLEDSTSLTTTVRGELINATNTRAGTQSCQNAWDSWYCWHQHWARYPWGARRVCKPWAEPRNETGGTPSDGEGASEQNLHTAVGLPSWGGAVSAR